MNRGRMMTKTIPLLISIGLFLSACAVEPDYGAPAYAYSDPIYGSLDFDYGGWGRGWGWGYGSPWFYGGFYPYYAAYPYPAYYPPPPPVYSQPAVYYAPRTVHRTYRRVRHRQHCTCSTPTSS